MTLSTSRSDSARVRFLILLAGIAVLAAFVAVRYSLHWNPEVRFWLPVATAKLDWVEKLHAEGQNVVGVSGGSSTTFGIDAGHLNKKYDLPMANMGLHAGMGPQFLAGFGLKALKLGDTLIVCIEPSMLCRDFDLPALGSQLAVALGRTDLLYWNKPTPPSFQMARIWPDLRPGGYHVFTMLGKLGMSKPLYRYSPKDSRPGGLQTTAERRPMPGPSLEMGGLSLSPQGKQLLEELREGADASGINIFYLLPWNYAPEENLPAIRHGNSRFLDEVEKILPVLRESELGAISDPALFADTPQHLTEEGAKIRSETLAKSLRKARILR